MSYQRTQMRLEAITGSLVQIDDVSSGKAVVGDIAANNLLDILGQFAGSIRRINGAADFTNQSAGVFQHETAKFTGALETSSSLQVKANGASITGTLDQNSGQVTFGGNVDALAGLDVTGLSSFTGSIDQSGGAQVTFSGNVDAQSGLDVTGANLTVGGSENFYVDLSGNVSGSANLQVGGTLTVRQGATLNSTLDQYGSSNQVTLRGNVDATNGLDVTGDDLTVGGLNFVVDVASGNVTTLGTVSGSGNFMTDGDLAVNGGDLTSTAASFNLLNQPTSIVFGSEATSITIGKEDGSTVTINNHLNVEGNLYVQGATTTVDSTTVTISDKTLVLGYDSTGSMPNDAELSTGIGAGLVITSSDGDHTFLWKSGEWILNDDLVPSQNNQFNLGSSSMKWKNLFVSGTGTVDELKVVGDTPTWLYRVGPNNEIYDEENLKFSSSLLQVTGTVDITADLKVQGTDADINATLHVDGAVTLDGSGLQLLEKTGGDLDLKVQAGQLFASASTHVSMSAGQDMVAAVGGKVVADVVGLMDLNIGGDFDLNSDDLRLYADDGVLVASASTHLSMSAGGDMVVDVAGALVADFDGTMSLDVADVATLTFQDSLGVSSDAMTLTANGVLYATASAFMSMSAEGIVLTDKNMVGSQWTSWGIELSKQQSEWTQLRQAFGEDISIIGALVSGGAGGKFVRKITSPLSASSALDGTTIQPVSGTEVFGGTTTGKWIKVVEPKIAKVDVFVNGQLLMSGSPQDVIDGLADYEVGSTGNLKFAFGLVEDDVVTICIR